MYVICALFACRYHVMLWSPTVLRHTLAGLKTRERLGINRDFFVFVSCLDVCTVESMKGNSFPRRSDVSTSFGTLSGTNEGWNAKIIPQPTYRLAGWESIAPVEAANLAVAGSQIRNVFPFILLAIVPVHLHFGMKHRRHCAYLRIRTLFQSDNVNVYVRYANGWIKVIERENLAPVSISWKPPTGPWG